MTITFAHFRPSSQLPEHAVPKRPELSKPSAGEVKSGLAVSRLPTFGSTRTSGSSRQVEFDVLTPRSADTARSVTPQVSEEAEPQRPLVRRPRAVNPQSTTPVLVEATLDDPRKRGDSQMAALVAQALRVGESTGHLPERIDNIVPTSTFGQWWAHLHQAVQSPAFLHWAAAQKLDLSKPIQLYPNTEPPQQDYIAGMVAGERTLFVASDRGNRWTLEPILQAARIISPTVGTTNLFESPTLSTSAPYKVVANFYSERIDPQPPEDMGSRAEQLEQVKAFVHLPPTDPMRSSAARSEKALEEARSKLIENHDAHQLYVQLADIIKRSEERATAFKRRSALPVSDSEHIPPAQLENQLSQAILSDVSGASITLHPDSPWRALHTDSTMTLDRFISENGWLAPSSHDALTSLAQVLTQPLLATPPHGNFGGALCWSIPLSDEDQSRVLAAITQNGLGLGGLPSDEQGVLSYLTRNLELTADERQNPRAVIQALLATPKAQALGLALERKFKGFSTPDSINDWVLAALGASLERPSVAISALNPVRTGVAGFNLASEEHWGKPPATVVKGLTNHLIANRSISAVMAPAAAHLLLSRKAPEFLVRDIPSQVVYGSHTWMNFTTAVARIEAQAPGASSLMTFAQVLTHATTSPITAREQMMDYAAQRDALVDWGVVNGFMPASAEDVYTDVQMSNVSQAFNNQVTELSAASWVYATPLPERKKMALRVLTLAFGDRIPFEKKYITTVPPQRNFPGPYSVLDLYLQERFNGAHWFSSSEDVPIRGIKHHSGKLPDINKYFSAYLAAFFTAMEKGIAAQVKSLISNLPLEDRKNIEAGKLTVIKETTVGTTHGGWRVEETTVPNALLLRTLREGVTHTYEIKIRDNTVSKRNELNALALGAQFTSHSHGSVSGRVRTSPTLDAVTPSGAWSAKLTDEKKGTALVNMFTHERAQYIAAAMVENVGIRRLAAEARGLTTFETEVPFHKKVREFLLNLIPLRSAIQNFRQGNIGEGVVDLTLDVFCFAMGLGVAAKGAKALHVGLSTASKVAHSVRVLGRVAVSTLNPLSGVDDLARGIIKGGAKALRTLGHGLNKMRGVDLASIIRKPGIAQGAYRAASASEEIKLLAKLDEKTGCWYAIHPRTKTPFGPPLENFKPNVFSSSELKKSIDTLYSSFGTTPPIDICYATALLTAQADKKITASVFNALIVDTMNGVSPAFYQRMNINSGTLKNAFNIGDINESGLLSFVSKNGYNKDKITHMAYLHKASDNQTYLYHSNSHILDKYLGGIENRPSTAGKANVYTLDVQRQRGLQQFMEEGAGFTVAFTPASILNARVLAPAA